MHVIFVSLIVFKSIQKVTIILCQSPYKFDDDSAINILPNVYSTFLIIFHPRILAIDRGFNINIGLSDKNRFLLRFSEDLNIVIKTLL